MLDRRRSDLILLAMRRGSLKLKISDPCGNQTRRKKAASNEIRCWRWRAKSRSKQSKKEEELRPRSLRMDLSVGSVGTAGWSGRERESKRRLDRWGSSGLLLSSFRFQEMSTLKSISLRWWSREVSISSLSGRSPYPACVIWCLFFSPSFMGMTRTMMTECDGKKEGMNQHGIERRGRGGWGGGWRAADNWKDEISRQRIG